MIIKKLKIAGLILLGGFLIYGIYFPVYVGKFSQAQAQTIHLYPDERIDSSFPINNIHVKAVYYVFGEMEQRRGWITQYQQLLFSMKRFYEREFGQQINITLDIDIQHFDGNLIRITGDYSTMRNDLLRLLRERDSNFVNELENPTRGGYPVLAILYTGRIGLVNGPLGNPMERTLYLPTDDPYWLINNQDVAPTLDAKMTAAHEFGHVVGLPHPELTSEGARSLSSHVDIGNVMVQRSPGFALNLPEETWYLNEGAKYLMGLTSQPSQSVFGPLPWIQRARHLGMPLIDIISRLKDIVINEEHDYLRLSLRYLVQEAYGVVEITNAIRAAGISTAALSDTEIANLIIGQASGVTPGISNYEISFNPDNSQVTHSWQGSQRATLHYIVVDKRTGGVISGGEGSVALNNPFFHLTNEGWQDYYFFVSLEDEQGNRIKPRAVNTCSLVAGFPPPCIVVQETYTLPEPAPLTFFYPYFGKVEFRNLRRGALTATGNPQSPSGTIFSNADQEIFRFNLTAGPYESVNVNRIIINISGRSNGLESPLNASASSNFRLYDVRDVRSELGRRANVSAGLVSFENLGILISAGTTKTFSVRADIALDATVEIEYWRASFGAASGIGRNTGREIIGEGSAAGNWLTIERKVVLPNTKDLSRYSRGEVFLVSDNHWQDVLSLVPATTWTVNVATNAAEYNNCQRVYGDNSNSVCGYPTLIYHNEGASFDADSIIYFMQQYNASKVTVINGMSGELARLLTSARDLGPGLTENQIGIISPYDYFSYWQSFDTAVYVENNYELALVASTFASLINAPLIIQGSGLDTENIFRNRNIILIGNINCPIGAICTERYSNLEGLQRRYIGLTNTDKIIVVNPNDLGISVNEALVPEKSTNSINELYGKTSLAAPILASAKHELIILDQISASPDNAGCSSEPLIDQKVATTDTFVENSFRQLLQSSPQYLTIISSPKAIPDSIYEMCERGFPPQFRIVHDWKYGSFNNNTPLSRVGRIYGITISDASSYVARSLFYQELFSQTYGNTRNNLLIGRFFEQFRKEMFNIKIRTSRADYDSTCFVDGFFPGASLLFENNRIFWQDIRYGTSDVFMYDLNNNTENRITTNELRDEYPQSVYGDKLTFFSTTREDPDRGILYLYDINTRMENLVDPINGEGASISGNKIVYRNTSSKELFLYNIDTRTSTRIASNVDKAKISGDTILFGRIGLINGELRVTIFIYNLNTNTETALAVLPYWQVDIYNNTIVYSAERNGNVDIFVYDLNTRQETQITSDEILDAYPLVYQDKILWLTPYFDQSAPSLRTKITVFDMSSRARMELFSKQPIFMLSGRIALYENKVALIEPSDWNPDREYGILVYNLNIRDSSVMERRWITRYNNLNCRLAEVPPVDINFSNKQVIIYAGHGTETEWWPDITSSQLPNLNLTYAYSLACSTSNVWTGGGQTFGPNFLRKGGIGYSGSVGIASYNWLTPSFLKAIMELTGPSRISLGEIHNRIWRQRPDLSDNPFLHDFQLLGDPTLIPYFNTVNWQ